MRVLVLAGTNEARKLAEALADRPGVAAVASLAGATRAPARLALPTRVGGFGGDAGFAAYLAETATEAVIDATHPFAARVSARSARLCAAAGVSYVQLLRPAWVPGPGDRWAMIDDEGAAAEVIPPGARVLAATGRSTLERLANMRGRYIHFRQMERPDAPFPYAFGEYLVGRAPFSVADEEALFRRLRIDWLLVKNAGGAPARPKLDAARRLGLPVAMVRRPPQPGAARVATVAGALAWLDGLA